MRPVLLFAIRSAAPVLVLLYAVAMLLPACLPVSDATGHPQAVSRLEYWIIQLSAPSAVWWQWTGGGQAIVLADRLPVFMAVTGWLALCSLIGMLLIRCDSMASSWTRGGKLMVAVLIGSTVLETLVFVHGSIVGTTYSISFALLIGLFCVAFYVIGNARRHSIDSIAPTIEDISFSNSTFRRLIGLLVIAFTWLAVIQVYGASVPTVDQDVRETDWWLAKHSLHDETIRWRSENSPANWPCLKAMPIIAIASATRTTFDDDGTQLEPLVSHKPDTTELYQAAIASKVINAILCLVGMVLAGMHAARLWGGLVGLIVAFLLISLPGTAELVRMGRHECLLGAWAVALIYVQCNSDRRGYVWWFLIAGACTLGMSSLVYVVLPAALIGWRSLKGTRVERGTERADRWHALDRSPCTTEINADARRSAFRNKLIQCSLIAVILLCGLAVPIRNTIVAGDPVPPWFEVVLQRIGLRSSTEQVRRYAFVAKVPTETVRESLARELGNNGESSAVDTPYRWANVADGVERLLWNSNSHGLILVPLAILGLFVNMGNRTRALTWLASLGFLWWACVWWALSPRLDRDWNGAMWLLVWPAASAIDWLMRICHRNWTASIVGIAFVWSVVVIPVWPTSDNRILVAIDFLRIDSGKPAETTTQRHWVPELNRVISAGKFKRLNKEVLVIGDNDDFGVGSSCVTNSMFDPSIWETTQDPNIEQLEQLMLERNIDYVVLDWGGVQFREQKLGVKLEERYRSILQQMLLTERLQPISWEINSSQAELFRMKEE